MKFEIIDFHTHPFIRPETNICKHSEFFDMGVEYTKKTLEDIGIVKICGSVVEGGIDAYENYWEKIKSNNNEALKLKEIYDGFYVPGFHIHPDYIDESIDEIKRMHKLGVNLIGEIVPFGYDWKDYSCDGLSNILDEAGKHNMVVSFHTISSDGDGMNKMAREHKDVVFVAAHPGEYDVFMSHLERMKLNENYYLDISGTGIFRHGLLRHAIDVVGADRILFGSDYPTCNPGMFVGGVLFDNSITDTEKEKIFSLNAKKLLNL